LLLGTAFPQFVPKHAWQFEALRLMQREGWTVQRRGDDLSRRLRAACDAVDFDERIVALRRAVWAERARIALRELLPATLGGAAVDITARELSGLADASVDLALEEAMQYVAERFGAPQRSDGLASRLVVFGLGKLGGLELNAGSDIDIIAVYDTDDGGSEITLHDHWSRVVRRVVAHLDTPTGDGLLWRVDLRLRPEGSRGAIANSVSAVERYYETWGRLWERAALLRARPMAGDLTLGEEIAREIFTPFVYRHQVDPSLATALAELVQRSRAELSPAPARDLKLGPGGIREAEFFIQSLQLIWGGREEGLRVTGSLAALDRLKSRGLVSDREAQQIADAYLLLRKTEHAVQWITSIQTHLLPESSEELNRLARILGFEHADALMTKLDGARAVVRELFGALAPEAPRPPPRHHLLLTKLEEGDPDLGAMAEREFGSEESAEHLIALARRPDGPLGSLTRERYGNVADLVLDALLDCAVPAQAAHYLRAFFGRFVSPAPYVAALAEDPRAIRRLVSAVGSSAFVGDAIVSRPDLADIVLFGGGTVGDAKDAVAVEFETMRRSLPPQAEDYERRAAVVTALRRAKQRVMVEVAVADLAGAIGTRTATRVLSELADEELDQAVRYELGDRMPLGLAVIAVGKLGGRDIGYGSDLDVLFIYDPEAAPAGTDPGEYFVRRAQRVIRLISEPDPAGPGYELDTRLRPSGSQGMLVTSLASFARYHGVPLETEAGPAQPAVLSSGAAWERQALLRARVAAGDRELGARMIKVAEVAAYERGAPPVAEMHRMRLRMQSELAKEGTGRFDLKLGRGGLLDVEFVTQWLQMTHGHDRSLRTTDTSEALDALEGGGFLPRRHYETLREAYRFLRRLEQRIHIQRGVGGAVLDLEGTGVTHVARRMDLRDSPELSARDALVTRYLDVSDAVRAAYLEILGVEE
jgi:glutamate-ammonia-ligase adenylyltransferase